MEEIICVVLEKGQHVTRDVKRQGSIQRHTVNFRSACARVYEILYSCDVAVVNEINTLDDSSEGPAYEETVA